MTGRRKSRKRSSKRKIRYGGYDQDENEYLRLIDQPDERVELDPIIDVIKQFISYVQFMKINEYLFRNHVVHWPVSIGLVVKRIEKYLGVHVNDVPMEHQSLYKKLLNRIVTLWEYKLLTQKVHSQISIAIEFAQSETLIVDLILLFLVFLYFVIGKDFMKMTAARKARRRQTIQKTIEHLESLRPESERTRRIEELSHY